MRRRTEPPMPRQTRSLNLRKAQDGAQTAVREYLAAHVVPLPPDMDDDQYAATMNAVVALGIHLYAHGYQDGITKKHHD